MPLSVRPADIRFDLPARPPQARLAGRSAAVAVADAADPHVRHDVRLTVDEPACVLTDAATPDARLPVRVWVEPATVVVEGRVVATATGVGAAPARAVDDPARHADSPPRAGHRR